MSTHPPRTTIEFSEPAACELDRLSHDLGTTKAEVVRHALSLYAFIKDELSTGRKTLAIVEDGDDVTRIVFVPGLQ